VPVYSPSFSLRTHCTYPLTDLVDDFVTTLQNIYDYHRQSIYDIIVHQYSDWDHATASDWDRSAKPGAKFSRESFAALLGDALVVAPVVSMATFHARHSRPGVATYLYEFNQPKDAYPRSATATPGNQLLYVFGAPLAEQSLQPFPTRVYTRAERLLSQTVIRYWSNFAKTGCVNTSSVVCSRGA